MRKELPRMIGYQVGQRVELAPHTDLWVRGARYGTIAKVGTKLIHVDVDKLGRTVLLAPGNIGSVIE